MLLKNKKIAFLGDSITEGLGVTDPQNMYWKVLERETGALCYGYGISGTRIAPTATPSANPREDLFFASRVTDMIPDADIVVVFGGTNDFGHGNAPFGSPTDLNEGSFCGAYHHLLRTLIERYPDAQIVVMTPLHRLGDTETGANDRGFPRWTNLEGYVDAIRAIAGFYGIPVLDLFRTSGLQPEVEVLRERFMPDGLHPNDAGHSKIASRLKGFLLSL